MAFAQVEIDAEMVLDAMNEDSVFALEIWEGFAERLNMGLMADNFGDMVSCMENKARAQWIIDQFKSTFDIVESLHLSDR